MRFWRGCLWFVLLSLGHIVSFYFLLFIGPVLVTLIFYVFWVNKCNLYVIVGSLVPMPFVYLAVIHYLDAGGWQAFGMFLVSSYVAVLLILVTLPLSFFMNRRKHRRQREGLLFYNSMKHALVVLGASVGGLTLLFGLWWVFVPIF